MKNNPLVIGLGEVVIDWVTELPYFPKRDEKIDALSENLFSGGATANFLVAVARLGVSCGFIGAVGDDSYGNFLLSEFEKENVNTEFTIKKKGMKTPVNFIFIVNGEKTIIQSPNMYISKLEPSDLKEDYIKKSKVLHTTIIHQDLTKEAIKIAKKHNVKVSIDLESQIAKRGWNELESIIKEADVLIPNKEGAKMITKTKDIHQAARILIKRGIPLVIITMGKKGALITTQEYQKIIPAYAVSKVVDTTGAGDTFNGAFIVARYINDWDIEKACRYANAAAALKIKKLGARTGMPKDEEISAFW
ncbi:MAG: carbohydrate kinase family protein [Promethearchaeota archaeon]|nr:MAG: carbohydrate kinase family protein [Candidatus Lokiarchaeota archaeon]